MRHELHPFSIKINIENTMIKIPNVILKEEVENAISIFFSRDLNKDADFIDACQLLIDSGLWIFIDCIAETCVFLIQRGMLLPPEINQQLDDGSVILGLERSNKIN
jgi:hypothetical protein